MKALRRLSLTVLVCGVLPALAQREHGFNNTKPSGQPYLAPEETVRRMKAHPGWEVKLFAAEPQLVNPIAYTVDERGRIWVVESFEYPKRTPKDAMPRDRIKVLEDTDGDGVCDKVTIWAEGKDFPVHFDMASGIEVGHGGVFLGAPPYLFFLRDTDGDDKCDKHEILLSGFGSQDTHETLNTFQWGPDGRLYGLHGVYTLSEVQGVKMDAAVWRYDVRTRKFEVFAEGTSNPWGMDFDPRGECFLCCCVIPHLFHMVPGATYIKQGNKPSWNPHAYGQLREICDHTHHKESGWAHAGLVHLEGKHVPADLQGSVIMGSIHGCSIKRNVLRRNGSTFIGSRAPDFVVSGDKNVRFVNLRWGPDGSIFASDWHDQYPCHQTPKDLWDYERGRIYRIVRTGSKPFAPVDLARKSGEELVEMLLGEDNPWRYRTALRLLGERRGRLSPENVAYLKKRAATASPGLMSLRALWGMHAIGAFDEALADDTLRHADAAVRAWTVRFVGEMEKPSPAILTRLTEMARSEPASEVRRQLASSCQRLAARPEAMPILQNLMKRTVDAGDPVIPHLLWLAFEPRIGLGNPHLDWLKEHASGNPLITNDIVPRTMRRLAAGGKPEDLSACLRFLEEAGDSTVRVAALRGLTQAFKGRQVQPPAEWDRVFALLDKDSHPEVQRLARQLAVNFRDAMTIRRALGIITKPHADKTQLLDAIRDVALARPPEAVKPLLDLLASAQHDDVLRALAKALAAFDDKRIPDAVLAQWKRFTPAQRVDFVAALRSRREWAARLLAAVGTGQVPRTDLNDNTILAIRAFGDANLNAQIEKVWGRFRETPAELEKLIAKYDQAMLVGRGDFARGRLVFEKNCMQCHRFDGQGHEVGPNLDGAERSIGYLLANVLDPNRVIGQPYFTRIILTKDGQLLRGLVAGEDENSVSIRRENNVVETIPRDQIDTMRTEERSLMPEGLDKNITEQDLRDLVRYLQANPFVTEVYVSEPVSASRQLHSVFLKLDDPRVVSSVRWQAPPVGPAGLVRLEQVKVNAAGDPVQVIGARVVAPAEIRTQLLLGTNARTRVWLNGVPVLRVDKPDRAPAPDQHSVEVTLKPGNNVLALEVSCLGEAPGVFVRFADAERKLRYPAIRPLEE